VYDVFILGLMTVGITSLVVFSYKIFHSRVYAVGIVRKVPAVQEYVEEASAGELISLLNKGWTNREIAKDLRLPEQEVRYHIHRKLDAKQQTGEQQHKLAIYYVGQTHLHEREDSALEEEVVEHGEALKLHSRIEDIEKRIRRLEVESVQKLQEATEEKLQSPQVVH